MRIKKGITETFVMIIAAIVLFLFIYTLVAIVIPDLIKEIKGEKTTVPSVNATTYSVRRLIIPLPLPLGGVLPLVVTIPTPAADHIPIRVDTKLYNPLRETMKIISADVNFLFKGSSVFTFYVQSCSIAEGSGVSVPAASNVTTYITCRIKSDNPAYNNLLVEVCGSTSCQLSPELLASLVKNIEVVSITYYFEAASGSGACILNSDGGRCYIR
ncbi:MAG: hypothetical protein QXR14_08805 [Sulfolobales archaeon]